MDETKRTKEHQNFLEGMVVGLFVGNMRGCSVQGIATATGLSVKEVESILIGYTEKDLPYKIEYDRTIFPDVSVRVRHFPYGYPVNAVIRICILYRFGYGLDKIAEMVGGTIHDVIAILADADLRQFSVKEGIELLDYFSPAKEHEK